MKGYFDSYSIAKTLSSGDLLLSDLTSWPTLQNELKEFLDEMTDNQREQFDNWCRDNLHEIESGDLSLKTSSQVVYFEAGKDMKVSQTYSDALWAVVVAQQ